MRDAARDNGHGAMIKPEVTLGDGAVVAARELSGRSGLQLRRDSQSGAVLALGRAGHRTDWGGLNSALHTND